MSLSMSLIKCVIFRLTIRGRAIIRARAILNSIINNSKTPKVGILLAAIIRVWNNRMFQAIRRQKAYLKIRRKNKSIISNRNKNSKELRGTFEIMTETKIKTITEK